jgi:transcription termination/antitermination protein NusA
MAMMSEFISSINQIAAERGIEKEEIFTALESAILVAYKKEKFSEEEREDEVGSNLTVELDRETGEFKLIATKEVVEKSKDDDTQISIEEAEMISQSVEVGDSIQIEIPTEDFGRIAAQTAKQVILQKIRESEKEAIISEYSDKVGEVFTALMQRMQRGQVVFEIGKATAYMPAEEQIPNEFYRLGDRYKVLLKDIVESQMIVSRADPAFLIELFKLEVPEIESGVLEVKAIAREEGSRSKMAVNSTQEGVDPIGSCVGQRGIRIANVMNELGEEKIDIIEWDEDPEVFVAKALSPAKIEKVVIEDETATVTVDDDQLSLAIGRDGQNVRLAWKLTGYKIDIVGSGGDVVTKEDVEDAKKTKTEEAEKDEVSKDQEKEEKVEKEEQKEEGKDKKSKKKDEKEKESKEKKKKKTKEEKKEDKKESEKEDEESE